MMGARTALRLILFLQIGLGCALAAADLARSVPPGEFPAALPFTLPGLRPPGLEAPVAPGDQRRRFVPSELRDLPQAGDMPSRLLFERPGDNARLTGQIAPGDAARFADWLEGEGRGASEIALHSTGGSVKDALAIGRLIRAAGMNTLIPEGKLCLSACPYILASGVERRVDPGAAVGVHQHFHGENAYLPAFLAIEDIQSGQSEVMAFLVAMGVDPQLMIPAMATPPAEIYLLVPEELEAFALVTPDE